MSETVTVKREHAFSYSIQLETDFQNLIPSMEQADLSASRICLVTDSNVDSLYSNEVIELLSSRYEVVTKFVIPAGESNKTLDQIQKIYEHLILHGFDRKDCLVALGGGVVGDMTGYAAATFLRGIDFVQIPTTLLAQVDSSIGGKTGVDFLKYKNMVGAFHQPQLVYMNMKTLLTLPSVQFACGMGEVLKTGLIRDNEYYFWLGEHASAIQAQDTNSLMYMIRICCQIKSNVVEEDPTEQGVRAILNLGHTIGHAVEKLMNFSLSHGECVALGTVAAAYISYKAEYLSEADLSLIQKMNSSFSLKNRIYDLNPEGVLKNTKKDKKMSHGKIKFVLLESIGNACVDLSLTDADLLEGIKYITGVYDE